jgi:uncharacterized RDD family membrane protein YckC
MAAQWINARLLKRGGREYRLTIDDATPRDGWIVVEEHSLCLDGSTDRAATEALLTELCEPSVSYHQAQKLLADLRGNVLDQPVARAGGGYASFGSRIVARFLDAMILAAFVLIAQVWSYARPSPTSSLATLWLTSALYFVYRVGMHARSGQTFGKMICEIAVRDVSGRPLRFWQALVREIVDILFFVVSAAFATVLFDFMHLRRESGALDAVLPVVMFLSPLGWLSEIWIVADSVAMLVNEKHRALRDFIGRSVVVRTRG